MKKTLAWLLVLLMAVAMFPVMANADDVVTLYVTDWESDAMNADIQKACDEIFSVEHPNIKVVVLSGSYSDYGQQITAMIQAGDDLDIFQQGYDGAVSNYQKGLIYDWSEYVAKEPDFVEGFYAGSMNGFTYKDAVVGLPGLGNVYGFFYNKDIIAEKGLTEPAADWTWDDFFALAEGLKDVDNGVYGCYGFTPRCVRPEPDFRLQRRRDLPGRFHQHHQGHRGRQAGRGRWHDCRLHRRRHHSAPHL